MNLEPNRLQSTLSRVLVCFQYLSNVGMLDFYTSLLSGSVTRVQSPKYRPIWSHCSLAHLGSLSPQRVQISVEFLLTKLFVIQVDWTKIVHLYSPNTSTPFDETTDLANPLWWHFRSTENLLSPMHVCSGCTLLSTSGRQSVNVSSTRTRQISFNYTSWRLCTWKDTKPLSSILCPIL